MSLHFIFGRAGTGKTARCCGEIVRYRKEHPEKSACLLVPDQATYRAETMLAAAFPGRGFVNVTVCGFKRLAYRVFKELREDAGAAPSPLAEQLILRRLLTARAGQFLLIGEAARQPHFAASLATFFHQLNTYGAGEEELAEAARQEGATPLGRKLTDLSVLLGDFHAALRAQYQYKGSLFDKLAEDIPRSEWLRDSAIWIDGFTGMTPQELAIAAALVRTARDVTVTLPMDRPGEAAQNPLFERPYRIWEVLQKEAGHSDGEVLTEPCRFTSPHLRAMGENFFSPIPKACPAGTAETQPWQGLRVTEAPSLEAEADSAARRIVHLVREEGLRWRDILVLLPSGNTYEDAVRRRFSACGIPVFIDQPQPMNNHPLVVLTDAVLRFLAAGERGAWRGWTRELLFPILKTDLLHALSAEETDRLENFVLRVGVRPGHWKSPWAFHTPFHLEEDGGPSPQEQAELDMMNDLRERILAFLRPLEEAWHDAASVKEKCTILYQWLMDQGVPDTLALWDDETYAATRERPHLQAWKKLLLLLDDLVRAAGDDDVPAAEFLAMAEDGLASLTFSIIPPTLDHVTVTTIRRGFAMEGRAVFLLGASEDNLPARVEESGFFSERETLSLRDEQGLTIGPDLMTRIRQEQFFLYLSLTRARQLLSISYASADDSGGEVALSSAVRRLISLGYADGPQKVLLPAPDTEDTSFLVNPGQALSLLPAVLREGVPQKNSLWDLLRRWALTSPDTSALLRQKVLGFSYQNTAKTLPPDVVQQLFLKRKPFTTSVTRLETYKKCPYQYFLQYGLGLGDRDRSRLDARDYGNYLHAGLHLFGSFLRKQQKQWRDATDEDIERISAAIADQIAPRVKSGVLLSDASMQYVKMVLDRNFRSALVRLRQWSRGGQADTIAMEADYRLRIGEDLRNAFLIDCHVDRVDRAAGAAIVADYKTGVPEVKLGEIAAGVKLQLITYLMAVLESGGDALLPGAILYIYLKNFTRSVSVPDDGMPQPQETKDQFQGYFRNDEDFLSALDRDGTLLGIKRNKDGSLPKSAPLLSPEDMKTLFSVVKDRLSEIYEGIRTGAIPIRPTRYNRKNPPCQYCTFRSICRFDPKLAENRYHDIPYASEKEVREMLKDRRDKEAQP